MSTIPLIAIVAAVVLVLGLTVAFTFRRWAYPAERRTRSDYLAVGLAAFVGWFFWLIVSLVAGAAS